MRPGDRFRVQPGFDRLGKAAEGNEALGAHLWMLIVTYGLTDQEAAHSNEGVEVLMDPGHLLAVTTIGCYICEQPYDEVVGKPCKGNPVGYDGSAPIYKDGTRG